MESEELLKTEGRSRENGAPKKASASYAYKIFQTTSVGIAQLILGITMGLDGTSYLDLLEISNSDVQYGSLIFTFAGVGAIVGSMAYGPLCDRFPAEAVLVISLLFTGVLTAITPWVPSLIYITAITFAAWIGVALIEAALPVLVTGLWKSEDGPFTHATYLCYAAGGVIGPVITAPFMSARAPLLLSSFNTSDSTENSTTVSSGTRIHIPFLIVGLTYEIIALVWLGIYMNNRKVSETNDEEEYDALEDDNSNKSSMKQQLAVLFLVGLFFTLYDGIENCFDDFLMTFLVAAFGWTKTNGARALTVFWCGYTGGKVLGVGLSKVISPCALMLLCLVGLNISLVIWIVLCNVYNNITWIMIASIGLFMSVVFPAGISFTNAYQSGISSKVISWIMTCADIGNTLNPLLMGYLMQNTTPMAYFYVLVAESAACLCVMLMVAGIVIRSKAD